MFIPAEIEFTRLLTAYERRYGTEPPIQGASREEAIEILRRQLAGPIGKPPPSSTRH